MTADKREVEAQLNSFSGELQRECEAHGIPERMIGAISGYVIDGYRTGGFLRSVMENDFVAAVLNADDENRSHLMGYARLVRCIIPPKATGSPEAVQAWIECGGLRGMQ